MEIAEAYIRNQTGTYTKSPESIGERAGARLAFNRARQSGLGIVASAKAAGISARTGTKYERERLRDAEAARSAGEVLMSRAELARRLTEKLRSDDLAPAYYAAHADRYSKLMGLDEPTKSISVVHQVTERQAAWLDSLAARGLIGESQAPSTSPAALTDSTVSTKQIASDNKRYVASPAAGAAADATGGTPPNRDDAGVAKSLPADLQNYEKSSERATLAKEASSEPVEGAVADSCDLGPISGRGASGGA